VIRISRTTSARSALERVSLTEGGERATAADLLDAVAETRPTLTAQIVAEFEQDIADYARL